jgi:Flp pilus assembly protein TadD
MRLTRLSPSHFFASTALATVLAVGLAGCQTTAKGPDTTGSIATASRPTSEGEWRVALDRSEALYKAKPDDVAAAMQYAQALRGTGQHTQAVAVLEQVSLKNPRNKQLLGAYGRALAEVGRYPQALEVLSRAHTPDMPDWRILSAQGAVLDQMGRYEEARAHYAAALKIAPDEPSVLSNLGLSYALSRDLKKAEATLRKATSQPGVSPRVRQNLPGSRRDRARRSAAGGSRRQCRFPAADGGAAKGRTEPEVGKAGQAGKARDRGRIGARPQLSAGRRVGVLKASSA